MEKIAVIGAGGFVGQALCAEIKRSGNYDCIGVTAQNEGTVSFDGVDTIIYSANSAKRFAAKNDPEKDFYETVERMYRYKQRLSGRKFVLVSTISARVQLDTPYGRNRRACETMLVNENNSLIFRLGPMYGLGKLTGALFDIVSENHCYVSESTRYSYTDVAYNARKILELIDQVGVIELGARNSIQLGEIKEYLGSSSVFDGVIDDQLMDTTQHDAPDAYEVLKFASNWLENN
ncbi:MAG: NAD-dependent epimerase/dehydratase family protein [Proteobacteria bacterium]|jgi:nucleoside-diphosphate-sugar epimerase|nr:NAD-dependent epimerase/dehydratase family protein [Pseudomonadota bacterium]